MRKKKKKYPSQLPTMNHLVSNRIQIRRQRNNKSHRTNTFCFFQYIMISLSLISLYRYVKRPQLLSSIVYPGAIAIEDIKVTNLPRSSSLHSAATCSNVGSCRNVSTSISSSKGKSKKQDHRDSRIELGGKSKTLYRRAVHVIHRHGDRTPITPLKNEEYWTTQLIPKDILDNIAQNTEFITDPNMVDNKHNANGRGPFGKLTQLGLQQMIDLGTKLRLELAGNNDPIIDEHGRTLFPHIFTPTFDPLIPSNIRVRSTNFVRTIQSVQGLIQGLIPKENYRFFANSTNSKKKNIVTIDIRHTDWMIPDPQPRRSKEQAILELEVSQQQHLIDKEIELLPFAIRMTKALQPLLADDARDADFGVPQQDIPGSSSSSTNDIKPLSWNQLAEITKCLAVRNMLPDGITKEDQEKISHHAAYRWFESFKHPLLSYYAMNIFTNTIVSSLLKHNPQEDAIDNEPVMNIWSAHDSTLICLMCAFHLEQPAVWPEYGSYLMIELLDDQDNMAWFVRFSLNGQVLKSVWDPKKEPMEMILLADLWDNLEAQNPNSVSVKSILDQVSYQDIENFYRKYAEDHENDNDDEHESFLDKK